MIISVINHTNDLIPDAELQHAIRAINRQIAEDFLPHWGKGATLRLEGRRHPGSVNAEDLVDMRGDAVIYLWHPIDVNRALGYHARNFFGIPYGFVFPQVSRSLGELWTVSLSHEALEMIVDPQVNLLVMGPHPTSRQHTVFHWYEVCDAVQTEIYEVDGIPVSNFVLPLYFTDRDEPGSRNDFLNLPTSGGSLRSFGVKPGGYIGYYNPHSGNHESFTVRGDAVANGRLQLKGELQLARRGQRYQFRTAAGQSVAAALRSYLE